VLAKPFSVCGKSVFRGGNSGVGREVREKEVRKPKNRPWLSLLCVAKGWAQIKKKGQVCDLALCTFVMVGDVGFEPTTPAV
jgi:hypothetical protein